MLLLRRNQSPPGTVYAPYRPTDALGITLGTSKSLRNVRVRCGQAGITILSAAGSVPGDERGTWGQYKSHQWDCGSNDLLHWAAFRKCLWPSR